VLKPLDVTQVLLVVLKALTVFAPALETHRTLLPSTASLYGPFIPPPVHEPETAVPPAAIFWIVAVPLMLEVQMLLAESETTE